MRPRRRLSEQSQRDLMTRQAALTALTQHPSWPAFEDEVDRKSAKIEVSIIARTLHSRDPLDTEEIVYWRGFIHGLRWLVAAPTGAEARLENFLRSARDTQTEEAA